MKYFFLLKAIFINGTKPSVRKPWALLMLLTGTLFLAAFSGEAKKPVYENSDMMTAKPITGWIKDTTGCPKCTEEYRKCTDEADEIYFKVLEKNCGQPKEGIEGEKNRKHLDSAKVDWDRSYTSCTAAYTECCLSETRKHQMNTIE